MSSSRIDAPPAKDSTSQLAPMLCLLGVVALLSSITPTMKYVFQHSSLTFLSIASGRIVIGFLFLAAVTACLDWKGLRSLSIADGARFGVLGILGVGSYVVAAYGLLYTNVTHYALVYSLLPTFTAFFSWCLAKDRLTASSLIGIALSWMGCLVALISNLETRTLEFAAGDPLVLLFTFMMAAHIVLSMSVVRHHGVLTANTAMFGVTAILISGCTVAWGEPASTADLSWSVWAAVLFIGLGTASVFLLRCRSLQSLSPATVGAYHNFIPICTIVIAHVSLGEPLTVQTMIGALAVLLGTELVRRKPRGTLAAALTRSSGLAAAKTMHLAGGTGGLMRTRRSPLEGGILLNVASQYTDLMENNRQYHRGLYRLPLMYPAMYCVTSTVGEGKITNLSAMGCLIETDAPLFTNQQVALRLLLPDQAESLPIDAAEVKWVKGVQAGVEFVQVEREANLRLHSFVSDKMIERIQLMQQQRATSSL